MVMVSSIVCIYYNVIIAWTIYYLFMSFRATLPWSHCNNEWNSKQCIDTGSLLDAELAGNGTLAATTPATAVVLNVSGAVGQALNYTAANVTAGVAAAVSNRSMSASEEFWE